MIVLEVGLQACEEKPKYGGDLHNLSFPLF